MVFYKDTVCKTRQIAVCQLLVAVVDDTTAADVDCTLNSLNNIKIKVHVDYS